MMSTKKKSPAKSTAIMPLPWRISSCADAELLIVSGHVAIAEVFVPEDASNKLRMELRDTASFIVRVCNAHKDMRKASQGLYDRLQEYLDVSDAELIEQGHGVLVEAMDGMEAAWRKADGTVPQQAHGDAA